MPLGPTRRVLHLLLALALLAGLLPPTAALAAPPTLPVVQPSPAAGPRVLVCRFVVVVWWGHNALGLPTRVQYGNGLESRLTYYGPDTPQWGALFFGRPRQNCVIAQSDPNCPYNGDSNALLNLSYWYDSVGNITSIRDRTNANQVQWFGYDALDRLTQAYTSATGSGAYSHTNAYSAIGNLTVISGTTQWYSDTAHVHAVTHVGGTRAYWYDANGNAVTRTVAGVTQALAWDGENRLASVTQGGTTYAYTYDGDGNRVKVSAGGVVTAYVGSTFEIVPATGVTTTYYFLGSTRVAMRTASGVTWLAGDHLGSTSLATNAAGQKVSDERYLPYGGTRSGGVPTDYQFTGQRKDAGTGLYYYVARYYDPATGRFISADTIVPSPGNPQALNRYSYVVNSPLRYSDPTGHCASSDYAARGCPSWMPDIVFGGLEMVAELTVSNVAFAPADAGQPDDLASLTASSDERWYRGAALGMYDPYDLADTVGECADGNCSVARLALGLAPVIPGKAATKILEGFKPIEQIIPIARRVTNVDEMHWIPQALQSQVRSLYPKISDAYLQFTDPIARGFHRFVHGKGGTIADSYNDLVQQWLKTNGSAASQDDFISFIESLRRKYLDKYAEYLTGG